MKTIWDSDGIDERVLICPPTRPTHWGDLKPYRFSFTTQGQRQHWIRFYRDMEAGFEDCKQLAIKENEDASGFAIESDQDSAEIRKSWGLA